MIGTEDFQKILEEMDHHKHYRDPMVALDAAGAALKAAKAAATTTEEEESS